MNKPLVHRLLMSDFCLLILSAARSGPSRASLTYDTRTIVSTRKANAHGPPSTRRHPRAPRADQRGAARVLGISQTSRRN